MAFILAQLLLVWFLANYLPNIVIYALAEKPYLAMDIGPAMALELSIMTLNLALPIAAILYFSNGRPTTRSGMKNKLVK